MNNTHNINFGSVVRLWHTQGRRGHDYVVCGVNKLTNELLLMKNNSINADGSIHASTTRFHKAISMVKLAKKVYAVKGVNTISGERTINKDVMRDFARRNHVLINFDIPKPKTSYVTSAVNSVYSSVSYD